MPIFILRETMVMQDQIFPRGQFIQVSIFNEIKVDSEMGSRELFVLHNLLSGFTEFCLFLVTSNQKLVKKKGHECLKRRQSLPALPAGLVPSNKVLSTSKILEEDEILNQSPKNSGKIPGSPLTNGRRRSSLAVLRRDSCKIS